jgi:hypothetical protein
MACISIFIFRKGSIGCGSALIVCVKLKWIVGMSQPLLVAAWVGGALCAIQGSISDVAANSGACGIYGE